MAAAWIKLAVITIGKPVSITATGSLASPLINKSNQRQRKQPEAVTPHSMTEMTGVAGLMKTETARTQGLRY
jgi:hypothetical protein